MAAAARASKGAPPGRGPKPYLLAGHFPYLRRGPLAFLTRCAREHGDFVPLRFFLQRVALVSHPAAIEDVLVTHQQRFTKSPGVRRNRRLLGNGLVASVGDLWRRQRRLMQPAFHRQRIAAYGDVMVAHAERLLRGGPGARNGGRLGGWRDGEVRDVHEEMMRLTLAIVAETLFGADIGAEAGRFGAALTAVMQRFQERLSSFFAFLPENAPTPGHRRFERAVRDLDAIVYGVIDRRRRSGEERDDLLSLLLHAQHEDDGSRMTATQVRDEAMTLMIAGHETTAIALTWTWYLLAQHPEVEARLLDELRAVLGGRAPAAADLPRLRYAEAVVTEAMRLYPPAWMMSRQATEDCEIGGYRVAAGTVVLMSQWVVHRDPRFYDRAEAFVPERWEDGLAKRLPRFAYFPFGGGPRLCIGNSFAMMEAVLLLATIAQRFRLTLVPGHPVVPWPVVTLRPRHGMRMTLHRR